MTVYFYNLLGGNESSDVHKLFDYEGNMDLVKYCIQYTQLLELKGWSQLTIWPENCLIGSRGHYVFEDGMDSLQDWSKSTGGSVQWDFKGKN